MPQATNIINREPFQSSDLALVAMLLTSGIQFEDVQRGNNVFFVFNNTKKLKETVSKFWSRQLVVEPLAYFDCIKHLKRIIYN